MPTIQAVAPPELVGAVDSYASDTGQPRSSASRELMTIALRSLGRWPPASPAQPNTTAAPAAPPQETAP